MYKKFILQLFLCNMLLMTGWFCVKGAQMNRLASTPAFKIKLTENYSEPEVDMFFGVPKRAASGQRIMWFWKRSTSTACQKLTMKHF